MAKYPYRTLGANFDIDYRNDLNANFDDIEIDVKAIDSKYGGLSGTVTEHSDQLNQIASGSQDNEVISARDIYNSLDERLDAMDNGFQILDQLIVATEGQTSFTINGTYALGQNHLFIEIDGIPQPDSVITETSSNTFSIDEALTAGQEVFVRWYEGVNVPKRTGHNTAHELGGYDEIDVTKLKNYQTNIADNFTNVNAELAETMPYTEKSKNSDYVLQIFNPYKNIENIHPKVLYFDTPWNGYNYWMAYTPYPRGNVSFENPCIAASLDGLNWETPLGVTNPLEPFSGDQQIYNNDTHLVFRADTGTLEIWWRLANITTGESTLKRRTSTNGTTWTPTENMLTSQMNGDDHLSPAVIFENNKYKMWSVSNTNGVLRYRESEDGLTWSVPIVVDVNWGTLTPWHLDVIHSDIGYEFVVQCWEQGKTNNTSNLYYVHSTDLITFSDPLLILEPSKELGKFDNQGIYRSSLLKKDGIYYLYYSAVATDGARGIAISYGEDIRLLKGVSSKSSPSQKVYGLEETYTKEQTAFDLYVENFITVQRQTSNPGRVGAFCLADNLADGVVGTSLKVHDGTKYNPLQIAFVKDFVMADNGTIQTLSTGVETVVNFTSRKRDAGVRWSTTTMKYTVSDKGIFTVHAHLDVSSLGGGSFELAVKVNGATKYVLTYEENLNGRKILQGTRTIQLATADTFEIVATYTGTGSPQIGVNRYLTIEKLHHNW